MNMYLNKIHEFQQMHDFIDLRAVPGNIFWGVLVVKAITVMPAFSLGLPLSNEQKHGNLTKMQELYLNTIIYWKEKKYILSKQKHFFLE